MPLYQAVEQVRSAVGRGKGLRTSRVTNVQEPEYKLPTYKPPLFAAPVRPLATLALTGRKPEGCALAFLDAPEVHTGYDADACLASLVDALLEDPRAGRGHTAGVARGI